MLRQPLSFQVLLTLFLTRPDAPAKPVEATLKFNECDEKGVKGTLCIKSHELPFVWSLSYEECKPKFGFPWVPDDVKDVKASRTLAKSAIDKFSKICLKLNTLPLVTSAQGNEPGIVSPKKTDKGLVAGAIVNDFLLEGEKFVLAQGCLRQLNYIASKLHYDFPNLSPIEFSKRLKDITTDRTPKEVKI